MAANNSRRMEKNYKSMAASSARHASLAIKSEGESTRTRTTRRIVCEQALTIEPSTFELTFNPKNPEGIKVKITTGGVSLPAESTPEVLEAVDKYNANDFERSKEAFRFIANGYGKVYKAIKAETISLIKDCPELLAFLMSAAKEAHIMDKELDSMTREDKLRKEQESREDFARDMDRMVYDAKVEAEANAEVAKIKEEFDPVC